MILTWIARIRPWINVNHHQSRWLRRCREFTNNCRWRFTEQTDRHQGETGEQSKSLRRNASERASSPVFILLNRFCVQQEVEIYAQELSLFRRGGWRWFLNATAAESIPIHVYWSESSSFAIVSVTHPEDDGDAFQWTRYGTADCWPSLLLLHLSPAVVIIIFRIATTTALNKLFVVNSINKRLKIRAFYGGRGPSPQHSDDIHRAEERDNWFDPWLVGWMTHGWAQLTDEFTAFNWFN